MCLSLLLSHSLKYYNLSCVKQKVCIIWCIYGQALWGHKYDSHQRPSSLLLILFAESSIISYKALDSGYFSFVFLNSFFSQLRQCLCRSCCKLTLRIYTLDTNINAWVSAHTVQWPWGPSRNRFTDGSNSNWEGIMAMGAAYTGFIGGNY